MLEGWNTWSSIRLKFGISGVGLECWTGFLGESALLLYSTFTLTSFRKRSYSGVFGTVGVWGAWNWGLEFRLGVGAGVGVASIFR